MDIDYSLIKLSDVRISRSDAQKMRGYYANKYSENTLFHNHSEEGLVYKYPFIQYKVIDGIPFLCGIKEGAIAVANVGISDDEIIIGNRQITVYRKEILSSKEKFGIADDYIEYKFKTPWLALNQKNMRIYEIIREMEREELMKSILIGNIISMSKGLGYSVESKINVWTDLDETSVVLKDINMKAFTGRFKVNFHLPDYMGIGKSVSRGFGTIIRGRG